LEYCTPSVFTRNLIFQIEIEEAIIAKHIEEIFLNFLFSISRTYEIDGDREGNLFKLKYEMKKQLEKLM
jgi:hypothetical protein